VGQKKTNLGGSCPQTLPWLSVCYVQNVPDLQSQTDGEVEECWGRDTTGRDTTTTHQHYAIQAVNATYDIFY